MTATVPSPERVLRALFWKLLFRGRAAMQSQSHRKRKQWGLTATLVVYGLVGLMPAFSAFRLDTLAFASVMHGFTFLFASLTLASSAGTMLFVREEAEILLHRPVRPEELLRAKGFVLIAFALLLAAALNAAGLVTGIWSDGGNLLFVPAHALVTVLLMLFSASVIVLVYNLCLQWFGRERLDNLLAIVQTLLMLVMIGASQLMPRLLGSEAMQSLNVSSSWALAMPPVWFGALDALLCGAAPVQDVWLPAAIAVAVTVLCSWLGFVRLGSAYGIGLMALNESTGSAPEKQRRRRLGKLLALPPLRWWLRDPVERQAFLLTSAYMVRDRETKLKLYPGLAPMLIMPLAMALGSRAEADSTPSTFLDSIAVAYSAIVPIQAMLLLHRSEHWRAADVFRLAPLPHWTPLFHGARKAVLFWLCLPALLLVAAMLTALRGSWLPCLLVLPSLAVLPVCSMIPGLVGTWLPLSEPNQDQRDTSVGCLVYGAVIVAAMVVGGIAAGMQYLGWFWPFLAVTIVLGLLLQRWFTARMRSRRWRPAAD